jgi:hypothetical protein
MLAWNKALIVMAKSLKSDKLDVNLFSVDSN